MKPSFYAKPLYSHWKNKVAPKLNGIVVPSLVNIGIVVQIIRMR